MYPIQYQLDKPTSGDFSTFFYQTSYIPTNYLSFSIGKIIYVPHDQHPIPSKEESNLIQTDDQKIGPSQIILSRQTTDRLLKGICLYLYYMLLLVEPTSEITFHTGNKQYSSEQDILKNFICQTITINNQEIFNEQEKYIISNDEVKKIRTVQFDDETNIPVIDKGNVKRYKYTANESCRIQQHILIQVINRLLCEKTLHLDYYVKKQAVCFISSINFNNYIDLDNEKQLIQKEITKKKKNLKNSESDEKNEKNEFDKLMDSILQFFVYFIDNVNGITKKLIIGNNSCKTNEIIKTEECIRIGRDKFIDIINELKLSDKTIEELI